MSSTVIRDFLVALTFKTDDSGAKKTKDALDSNEKSAKLLSRALIALASTAVIAVAKTANELEKLYYSSKRIGASAENIRAYGDAISQMGGSAEGAISSLESVARKLRESPGYEGMLKGLGVNTRDQNGQMRDRVEVMKDLSKTLQGMEYYKANSYAGALGIDETTLQAMRDGKFTSEMEKYQKLRKDMGLNDDLAKSGQEFAYQWRDMMMQLKALLEVILMTAGKALIPVLKLLNQLIQFVIHWFGQLDPQLKSFLATGLKIAMLTLVFGGLFSAVAKFAKLLPMLSGLLNIFKALRLVFLASPIGIVLALAAAIALLWDDYQTWKNGGESLIDWSKWSNGLDSAIESIKTLSEQLRNLAQSWIEFGKGSYDKVVEWTSRNIVERVANAIKDPEQAKQQAKAVIQSATTAAAKAVSDTANNIIQDANDKTGVNTGKYKFSFGKDVDGYIQEASKKYNIPEDVLRGFVKMEAGWTGEMSPTGAIGTGQFTKGTWNGLVGTNEGDEIGMTKITKNNFRKSDDPRWNKKINTLATGLLAKQNADILKKYGLPATGENLYLAHNIGAETFARALAGKGASKKGLQAMKDNGMRKGETPEQFVKRQASIYMKHYKTANETVKNEAVAQTPANKESLARMAQNASIPEKNTYLAPTNAVSNPSSKKVELHQKTDIHISGVSDPVKAAKTVQQEQNAVNLQMTRNAKGVFD